MRSELPWTRLIGNRALAAQWESTYNPPSAKFYKYRTPLSQISLFVLLDLLGSGAPRVPSYYKTTHWAYRHLSTIESRLRAMNLLESTPKDPFLPDVNQTMSGGGISDDHLPFIARGVEILHIIPSPFPAGIWHTMNDDGEHLDMATVRDWTRIFTAFALEWLDMMEVWNEPGTGVTLTE